MTEEEIAEANGELLPERRAMSLIGGVDPPPQSTSIDEAPNTTPKDPQPDASP